ncbi:uncharacterized protein V1518DRAFT_373988 [Limtongia smithiae]|uniref:uncharacterized protein n=1 Tax=Limtongia smithiae TaxID=1125753 RepID=UPI0034CF65FF
MDNARLRAVRETLKSTISVDTLFSSSAKDSFPEINGDVVIMGGYRGSILRDAKTRRRVWIPLKVGLNIRKINLELGLTDEDELHASDSIIADGILSHIGPVDVSRKLMKRLEANPNNTVHDFGYDWRLSGQSMTKSLLIYLKKIRAQRGRSWKGAVVIAHSMGGLVAHGAMQEDPSLFRGLLYVGSPCSCVNILGPMRYGESVLLSNKVLTAQANFTMRSSFLFLPLDGKCFVDKTSGEHIRLDFFDANIWTKYRLSPCAVSPTTACSTDADQSSEAEVIPQATSTLDFTEATMYLQHTLDITKAFQEHLRFDSTKVYPPLAVVYGSNVPTVCGARVNGEHDIFRGDYDDMRFAAGDGVVVAKNLMPPDGFKLEAKLVSDRGHVGLLSDLTTIGKALTAILDEEVCRQSSPPHTLVTAMNAQPHAHTMDINS